MKRVSVRSLSSIKPLRFSSLLLRFITDGKGFGNTSIVHEYLPARSELPTVLHRKTAELILMLEGTVTAVIGRKKMLLKAGHIVLLPAKTPHRFVTGRRSATSISIFSPPMSEEKPDAVVLED